MRGAGFKRPYSDPALDNKEQYGKFVQRLLSAGLVDLTSNQRDVYEKVGAFTVKKIWKASPRH